MIVKKKSGLKSQEILPYIAEILETLGDLLESHGEDKFALLFKTLARITRGRLTHTVSQILDDILGVKHAIKKRAQYIR